MTRRAIRSILDEMRILRGMIVAWMVLWLGASGALAAVMPYCDHALRTDAAIQDMSTAQDVHAPMHHGHEHARADSSDAGHVTQHGTNADSRHSGIACDKCGACNLMSSAIPATMLLEGVSQLHAVQDSFVLSHFRGWFPEQPYHPPRAFRPA